MSIYECMLIWTSMGKYQCLQFTADITELRTQSRLIEIYYIMYRVSLAFAASFVLSLVYQSMCCCVATDVHAQRQAHTHTDHHPDVSNLLFVLLSHKERLAASSPEGLVVSCKRNAV